MTPVFDSSTIHFDILRQRACNMRWAEQEEGVIPLTAADMDFPCAPEIVQAVVSYAQAGYFSYTPKTGLPEFKESIARMLNEKKKEGFALDLQKGSVTALTTAFRLWQLPVGLFGVATGMVVLPAAVSYPHLDVYKRQEDFCRLINWDDVERRYQEAMAS